MGSPVKGLRAMWWPMQVRILLTLALAAIGSFSLAVWAYQSGAGLLTAVMVYAFGGSVLTVLIAAVQVVLEPVMLPAEEAGPALPMGETPERA